ncbi:class I SAM-dependent methyltransferase [Verrucomicrobiota bacterium]
MKTDEIQFYKHKSKSDSYIKIHESRKKWEHYFESQQVIMEKIIRPGMRVLDVGCATGACYEALKGRFGEIDYTGFDISPAELEFGKARYPEARFVCGNFYEHDFGDSSYDVVVANLIVSHQRDWKDFIGRLIELSMKYVIFDVRLRHDGTTITDLDTSYLYYHGSGRRNHMVVFNTYEFLSFLHIDTFRLKKIAVHGYYPKDKTSGFIPMPKSKMIAAGFGLEKYDEDVTVDRRGGQKKYAERPWMDYDITLPDFSMDDI